MDRESVMLVDEQKTLLILKGGSFKRMFLIHNNKTFWSHLLLVSVHLPTGSAVCHMILSC